MLIYVIIALYCTVLSCIRLFCDPMDCCPPGSFLHGIFRNTGVGCRFLPQGSSPPRDHDPHSCASCIGRWILYHCTTWEALIIVLLLLFSRQVMSISCNPTDCKLPVFSIHGISQARILEWIVISFSRGSCSPRVELTSPTYQVDPLPLRHVIHILHNLLI